MFLLMQRFLISTSSEISSPFDHTTLVWGTQIVAAGLGWCASRVLLKDGPRNERPTAVQNVGCHRAAFTSVPNSVSEQSTH
jgi:hypothetical protein